MEAMGFDTFNVGPEAEYFLFKDDKGTETLDEGGYFAQTTMDAATGVRRDTIRALESMGIPVEYHHHEVGPSQHEIDIQLHERCSTWPTTWLTLPARREGGLCCREAARLPRDVHAEAAVPGGERLRGCTCTCRSSPTATTRSSTRPTSGISLTWRRRSSPDSCGMPASCLRSSRSGSTRTSGSCRASRRRSTSHGRSGTARP